MERESRPLALGELLRNLRPQLRSGVYVFCTVPADADLAAFQAVAMFREAEEITLILEERIAQAHGLTPLFRAAWITLSVNSDLEAVGLTAAVARALADAGISCNVVAAAHHDHLFVPCDKQSDALRVLERLQSTA